MGKIKQLGQYFPTFNLRVKQTSNIIMITFWSQFASYAFNTIFVLFLTRPLFKHGLGYDQAQAYAFIGIAGATGYLTPLLGGYMADNILGIRRSILLGSAMLAVAYLLVMLSSASVKQYGDILFVAAYALLPASNSLLIGTATAMVSKIYEENAVKAKTAMTYYYLSINIGALLATCIAPQLFDSAYGPLSVLAVGFLGKIIAALNFSYRYKLYNNIIWGQDKQPLSIKSAIQLLGYFIIVYTLTLCAYIYIPIAQLIITLGCIVGIGYFFIQTCQIASHHARLKQLVAFVLIIESIIFFIIYNQMSTTLVLLAQNNSDRQFLGLTLSPAQYQMVNPFLIILIGLFLPHFYRKLPRFSIPYQFACGTLLAGSALLLMYIATLYAQQGMINGYFIFFTYVLISLGELFVSAIGFSMIGLYCDPNRLAFAMGVWLLGSSLASVFSGQIARFVSIPDTMTSPLQSLPIYQHYYFNLGSVACCLGIIMAFVARMMHHRLGKQNIQLN